MKPRSRKEVGPELIGRPETTEITITLYDSKAIENGEPNKLNEGRTGQFLPRANVFHRLKLTQCKIKIQDGFKGSATIKRHFLSSLRSLLRESKTALSDLEKEGLIQRFAYTFELAWKTLQDLLEFKGYLDINGPNPVLEQSLKDGYIDDERKWRQMKKSRELTSHTYDSATADGIAESIVGEYYKLLK